MAEQVKKWLGPEDGRVYFDADEFDCPGIPGSGLEHMNLDFVRKLNETRKLYGRPMYVTSGYRTVEREKAILAGKPGLYVASMAGPNPFSSHTGGYAADIACTSSKDRFDIIRFALKAGINRIGGDARHIHLDDDPRQPPNVFWFE